MRPALVLFASELARRGEAFALATVVRREAPSSAQVGDTALITKGGAFHGWVGGSCTHPTVVREALAALDERAPRLIALSPSPDAERRPGVIALPMTCHSGGSVDIYIEPVLAPPRLVVFGASPIAQAIARIGHALGYGVDAVDPDADRAGFPEADRVFTSAEAAPLRARADDPPPWVAAIVATMGQWDEDAVRVALAIEPAYLAVVASRARFSQIRDSVIARGTAASALAGIVNPAGLDIHAHLPEEIALSVLAQIVQTRNRGAPPPKRPQGLPVMSADAIDPICGMTVTIASAKHKAEFGDRTFYFCCGGCREQFLREPERYAAIGAPGGAS
jgi:xanthine dehydrogenase accessory factor